MASKKKIGFGTKFLSNHNYLNQVPVDGKKTNTFNFITGNYIQYAKQIIRTGNCITLLSDRLEITEDSFWNISHFEIISKYIFFTFNKSFLLKLIEKTESLKPGALKRCAELLHENPAAYNNQFEERNDEELQWCYVKNDNLKKDNHFNEMYELDRINRAAILEAVEKRISQLQPLIPQQNIKADNNIASNEIQPEKQIKFPEMLRPMNGSQEEALNFIIGKTEEAKFKFDIFTTIPKSKTGKNPYKLNGCIGAMLDFFYQHNYFKKEYSLPDIFKSFLQYSGNSIPKLDSYISSFRDDSSFVKHFENLKKLKINKLSS